MRFILVVLVSLPALIWIGGLASAAPKKYSDAEMGRMRDECRQEVGKMKSGKKQAVGACVRRKKGKE